MRRAAVRAGALLLLSLAPVSLAGAETSSAAPPPASGNGWSAFALADLQARRVEQERRYLEFLSEGSFSMGLYHLPAGGEDRQGAHPEDEIYYMMNGSAKLTIDGVDHAAEKGSAFFVKAGVDHRFHSIASDLDVLVVFRKGPSGDAGPVAEAFTPADMVATRDPSANQWNRFLSAPTVSLGLYMLPESNGGDDVLTHEFDEINIVVNGRGRFVMGSDAIEIGPGSIMHVKSGVGHRFTDLDGDLDVLIFWAR